jgi:predicted transposase/invertase (TIGR01784 family)
MTQLIRFDWAIKYILRDKANFDILEGFLSELIGDDLKIHRVLESEANQEHQKDKFNRVDLLVENSQRELIIIEIQNELEYDYFQRMLYGTAKAVVENIALGQTYSHVKKVIMVTIIYFDLGQGEDYVYHGTTNFIGRHHHDELKLNEQQKTLYGKTRVCDLYPEYYVLKVEQFDDTIREQLDEWLYFLKHEEIAPEFKAKGLQQAKEKLDVLKMTPEQRRSYNIYLEDLRYMASIAETQKADLMFKLQDARTQGLEEGKQAALIEVARQLLDVLDDETISLKTGLTLAQVQQLRHN